MLDALSWALTAAAVLLVFYALRVVTQDRDSETPGKKAGLGCGFFFLACLLCSLAAHRWVGGWLDAFRLGMGIFLATPAIGALTKPHGSRLFLGIIGLILGVLLAGPVIKDLVLDDPEDLRGLLASELEELREGERFLIDKVAGWEAEHLEFKASLEGFGDLASLNESPEAAAEFKRWKMLKGRLRLGEERLEMMQARIAKAELQLAAEENADEEQALRDLLGLESVLPPTEQELTLVEEAMRQTEDEALFLELKQ